MFRHGIPVPVMEADFSAGMVRDVPRTSIPDGGVYRMQDFLCDQPGKVYKRGGAAFASPAVNEQMINICAMAEFPNDPRLVMISSNAGNQYFAYDVTKNTAWPGGGLTVKAFPYENPQFWVHGGTTGSLFLTHGQGGVTPQRIYLSGATLVVQDLPGAPAAKCSCVHLNRLVLANTNENPNRIWFSEINDPLNWSQVNGFYDTENEVIGMASVGGQLLVFHRGSIQRIMGEVPPGYGSEDFGVPSNMQLQPVARNVGCFDARTIVQARGNAFFANEYGIYYTNGGAPTCITTRDDAAGIGQLWRGFTYDLAPAVGAVLAQGVYADTWLFSSCRHPAGMNFQTICHLPSQAFVTTSLNIACVNYASRVAPHAGIYGCDGNYSEPVRLLDLSTLFTPYPGPALDADGAAVLPVMETRMVGQDGGLKAYYDAYLTYDIRPSSGNTPRLQVEVGTNIEGSNFKTVPESPMKPTSTEAARRRFSTSVDANSIQYRLTQLDPSALTEIYMIESSYHSYYTGDGRFP